MSRDVPEFTRKSSRPDALSRYLRGLGVRKLESLSQRSGFPSSKLEAWRDDPESPIRYVEAVRLVEHSKGGLRMEDLKDRSMPDRQRFDNPLGRKIALSLADGATMGSVLSKHGMTHVELGRWLTDNVKWQKATKHRIMNAFSRNGVLITEEDFEDQKVDRLRVRYEEAREDLDKRRRGGSQ